MKLQYVFWMLVIGLTAAIITADAEKRDYWEAIVEQWAERGYIMPKPPARIDTGAIVIDGESNTYSINGNTIEIEPPSVSATGAAYDLVANDPNAIRRLAKEGSICKAMGHKWEFGWRVLPVECPPVEYRYCVICYAEQTRTHKEYWTEWE